MRSCHYFFNLYANVQLVKHERDIVTTIIFYYTTTDFHYAKRDSHFSIQHIEVLALRSVIFITKISKFHLKCLLSFFPIHNTSVRRKARVAFHIMKLDHYVIVDDCGNYVLFHELNSCIKIKKSNNTSQRKLGPPVFHYARFIQPSNAIQHNS